MKVHAMRIVKKKKKKKAKTGKRTFAFLKRGARPRLFASCLWDSS